MKHTPDIEFTDLTFALDELIEGFHDLQRRAKKLQRKAESFYDDVLSVYDDVPADGDMREVYAVALANLRVADTRREQELERRAAEMEAKITHHEAYVTAVKGMAENLRQQPFDSDEGRERMLALIVRLERAMGVEQT